MDELRPDIDAAKRAMSHRMGAGRGIKRLTNYLWEHEQVRLMASGSYGSGTGLIVITDRRLLFVKDGLTSQTSEDVVLERITSVQWSAGMAAGTLTVFASGNRVEIKNLNKMDGKRMAETLRAITSGITGPDTVGPARPAESLPHAAPHAPYPPLRPEIPTSHDDTLYGRAVLPAGPQDQDTYYPHAGRHDAGYQYRHHEAGYSQDPELSREYQYDYQTDPAISWTQPASGVPVSPAVGWLQPPTGVPVSPAVGWPQPPTGVPVSPAVGPWDAHGRTPDAYDLLRMVDTLHAAGLLNDHEAAAKRAYLLDRR